MLLDPNAKFIVPNTKADLQTCRKQFFKLAHRNPVIIAGQRGGQAVKTLIKILEVGCSRVLALYTGPADGC